MTSEWDEIVPTKAIEDQNASNVVVWTVTDDNAPMASEKGSGDDPILTRREVVKANVPLADTTGNSSVEARMVAVLPPEIVPSPRNAAKAGVSLSLDSDYATICAAAKVAKTYAEWEDCVCRAIAHSLAEWAHPGGENDSFVQIRVYWPDEKFREIEVIKTGSRWTLLRVIGMLGGYCALDSRDETAVAFCFMARPTRMCVDETEYRGDEITPEVVHRLIVNSMKTV